MPVASAAAAKEPRSAALTKIAMLASRSITNPCYRVSVDSWCLSAWDQSFKPNPSDPDGVFMPRAVVFHRLGGPEVLEIGEVAVGRPGPGEVQIRVKAFGL